MRKEIEKTAEDIAYRIYEKSGKSQYVRAEWADKPYHPDDAAKDILALITTSNKALLRRVRERSPKDMDLTIFNDTTHEGKSAIHEARNVNYQNAQWHQALNEEERLL